MPKTKDGQSLVYVDGAQDQALRDAVAKVGGTVTGGVAGRVRAAVTEEKLPALAASTGVRQVRRPDRAVPMATISEGVAAAQANEWAAAGKKGAGVRIGVIDVGFGGLPEAQEAGELPTSPKLVVNNSNCIDSTRSDEHGTKVAEVVHDMAPEASLVLACVDDTVGFAAAADWLKQQGVTVIAAAIGFGMGGRGDGTDTRPDSPAAVVKRLREAGILWAVAAGNQAQLHYGGQAVDRNNNGWVEFGGGPAQGNSVSLKPGEEATISLRWDAWPTTTKDLDLYVTTSDQPPGENDPVAGASLTRQRDAVGGAAPTEQVVLKKVSVPTTYWIYVRNHNAPATTPFEVSVLGPSAVQSSSGLQFPQPAGSITEPASSPYALAVGAITPTAESVENYSSQGPTVDGRLKPDLAGYSRVSTFTGGRAAFGGTSAAAAHVAGAAAVLKSANAQLDAAQLETLLITRARENAGTRPPDNQRGNGKLSLGDPRRAPLVEGNGYTPLGEPKRILNLDRPFNPKEVMGIPVPDIPLDTTAVVLNVSARSDAETSVEVFATNPAQSASRATNLKVRPGVGFTAVSVIATVTDQTIWVRNQTGNTHVVIDLAGHFSSAGSSNYFAKSAPERVLDTRGFGGSPRGHLNAGQVVDLRVRGVHGIPSAATAVAVNITALEATQETWLSAYTRTHGNTSTLNLRRGERRSNLAVVGVADDNMIRLRNEKGGVNVIVDVVGWFGPGPGGRYVALREATRVVDTRTGSGLPKAPLGHAATATVQIGGLAGVSAQATAAALTVTGTEDYLGTELSLIPAELGRNPVTQLGVGQAQTMAAATLTPLGASGKVNLRNERGRAQVSVDVNGYFVGGTPLTPGAVCPAVTGESGFDPLFDGRVETGLVGWQQAGAGPARQEGCELVPGTGDGVSWYSTASFGSDYTVKLDYRTADDNADSGVFVGFPHPVGNVNIPRDRGVEVQIGPRDAQATLRTGGLVGLASPTAVAQNPVGEWNTYEITVSGNKITVVLNGKKVNEHTMADRARLTTPSFVGVQNTAAAGQVRFRDVRVRRNAVTGVGSFAGINGKCLDITDGNPVTNGVRMWGCNNERAQSWTLSGDGTIRGFGRCLDIRDAATHPGAIVQLWECNQWDAQQWIVRADNSVVNVRSGLCLNATGSADGAGIDLQPCSGRSEQVWQPRLKKAITGALVGLNNQCVDVVGGNPDGTEVWLFRCTADKPQSWSMVEDSTIRAYGRCLDVQGGGTTPGTAVMFWNCSGGKPQQWELRPDGELVNPPSGLCLTSASGAERAKLTLENCAGLPTQTWRFAAQILRQGTATTHPIETPEGKCLDVKGGTPSGNEVWVYSCTGNSAQNWSVSLHNDGTLRAYGRCLDVENGGTANGTTVRLFDCNGDNAQQWAMRPDGTLVNNQSDRCLDAGRGDRVFLYDCHAPPQQRWGLTARAA
ncbi:ricin-type beta-trefoil lectin domain protein [Crossiella sp. CA198]|uniref:ricin-type beta-trefoil lectin domain protein n=1 Tax=Crossiella sp. CA198 TaxID=3455607 RepID=UPI003F8D4CE8